MKLSSSFLPRSYPLFFCRQNHQHPSEHRLLRHLLRSALPSASPTYSPCPNPASAATLAAYQPLPPAGENRQQRIPSSTTQCGRTAGRLGLPPIATMQQTWSCHRRVHCCHCHHRHHHRLHLFALLRPPFLSSWRGCGCRVRGGGGPWQTCCAPRGPS